MRRRRVALIVATMALSIPATAQATTQIMFAPGPQPCAGTSQADWGYAAINLQAGGNPSVDAYGDVWCYGHNNIKMQQVQTCLLGNAGNTNDPWVSLRCETSTLTPADNVGIDQLKAFAFFLDPGSSTCCYLYMTQATLTVTNLANKTRSVVIDSPVVGPTYQPPAAFAPQETDLARAG
jgi:hypothetical protein